MTLRHQRGTGADVLGLVMLRARAHRLLLTAALLTVLLTTCVLATLAAFSTALGEAGLRQTLQHQSAGETTIDVNAAVDAAGAAAADRRVAAVLRDAYGGLPTRLRSSLRSGPYALPAGLHAAGAPLQTDGSRPDLTLFATLERSQLVLTSGRWPGRPGPQGAVPAALPEAAARALGLHPGALLGLTDRLGGPPVQVELTGVFRPADPAAAYWRLDPLGGRGEASLDYTTYGPLLVDPGTFATGRIAPAAESWQATADFGTMTTSGIGALRDGVRQAVARLSNSGGSEGMQASSPLPDLLATTQAALLTSRSTLLVGALPLVILAAFALFLVAELLAGERTAETWLLRARGASRGRVVGLAAGEALLLAVPAGLAAPLLAAPLVRLLAGHGALARTGTRLGGSGPLLGSGAAAGAWLAACCTAAVCALAVILPSLRRPGTYVGERAARLRAGARSAPVRAGAHLALLLVAGLDYWELDRRTAGSGPLGTDAAGPLGIDPVLVTVPALGLLAGAVLLLRLLPPAARALEHRTARGRGLLSALAGWQLARRPGRGTMPALLLVMAVALGVLSIGQSAGWEQSQRDQADFLVGTDIRATGSTIPPFGQGGGYDALRAQHPGITAIAPAYRTAMALSQDRSATVLAMDTTAAAAIMRLRPDLADRPPTELLRPLHAAGGAADSRDTGGFTVPGSARALQLTVRLESLGADGRDLPGGPAQTLTATLIDRYGVAYPFSLGTLPADGRDHVLTADLAAAAGQSGSPAGPLRLTGLDGSYPMPASDARQRLTVGALRTIGADGTSSPVPVPGGSAWQASSSADSADFVAGAPGYVKPQAGRPSSDAAVPLSVEYGTGAQPAPFNPYAPRPQAGLSLRAAAPPVPALNAVASDAFLQATGAKVGGQVHVALSGTQLNVRITGSVRALPGTAPPAGPAAQAGSGTEGGQPAAVAAGPAADGGAILLDLRAVDRALNAQGAFSVAPTEWWVGVRSGSAARVAAALRAGGQADTVLSRDEVLAGLRSDPLGAGPQSALPAALVAAAALAAVGFAVGAMGAFRERSAEFAVLRALGAPRSHLARMVAAEQGVLTAVALAAGVALGVLLTRLMVPLIVLTSDATRPVPPVAVLLPPGPIAVVAAAQLALPLVTVLAIGLRRGPEAAALRQQGDF